jgi:hypothetical protein
MVHIKKAFPWAAWIHRHTIDRAFIAYSSQEKVFQICAAPPSIEGIKLACHPVVPFMENMLNKVVSAQKKPHALLDIETDLYNYLQDSTFIVFCAYASSNSMTVEKWQEFFPHCYYIHRTANRSKCYVFFTDLQHAKFDAQNMYQRPVFLPTKEGNVNITMGCRMSTEREALRYMMERAENCVNKMAEHDAVVESVCNFVLSEEEETNDYRPQRFVLSVF